jgi:hypothetical protein
VYADGRRYFAQGARDFDSITSNLAISHTYDAAVKAEYCSDERQMRGSLQKLLHYKAERILLAHGTPILLSANERFRGLLNTNF